MYVTTTSYLLLTVTCFYTENLYWNNFCRFTDDLNQTTISRLLNYLGDMLLDGSTSQCDGCWNAQSAEELPRPEETIRLLKCIRFPEALT